MMSSSFKKKLLPVAMSVAMASGVSLSSNVSAIHLAEDGVGQVLLSPFYIAGTYKTKYSIVNTRSDIAVKAKVVIRSAGHSQELLDFVCYMTPADVCKFEIVTEADGKTYLTSTDDSVKSKDENGPQFASVVPVKEPLNLSKMLAVDPNDSEALGHVEIVGVYAASGTIQTAPVWGGNQMAQIPVTVQRTMAKQNVARIFDTPRNPAISQQMAIGYGQVIAYPLTLDNMNAPESATVAVGRVVNGACSTTPANAGVTTLPCSPGVAAVDTAVIRSTDPRVVRLSGLVEIEPNDNSDRMGYKIPALAGEIWDQVDPAYTVWENNITDPALIPAGFRWLPHTPPATAGINGGFDGRVIANPNFDATVFNETLLGVTMGWNNGNNILEIEHALATENIRNNYEHIADNKQTQEVITFPTKYLHRGNDVCNTYLQNQVRSGSMTTNQALVTYTPPFSPDGRIRYALSAYDNQENSKVVTNSIIFSPRPVIQPNYLPGEVNYFIPSWPDVYTSGWFDMALSQTVAPTAFSALAGCDYSGVPALSLSHYYIKNDAGQITNSWMLPNSHSPELVNRQYNWNATGNSY
ncbi:hypothetical protein [Candidatus Venteria ishoeyi]|uniref:DUF4842 domain-containing protein n=1 Tax=Candidatus Venteria ishoeyi TaxID=1899563 RepID=A0A1H6F7L8_9GAMM|nr:hypothetical protein [Candidatus Venteria ishoeyi]SEH05056.1 Uncharacterised protein [Candidatus Venteria ishoeyi]